MSQFAYFHNPAVCQPALQFVRNGLQRTVQDGLAETRSIVYYLQELICRNRPFRQNARMQAFIFLSVLWRVLIQIVIDTHSK